MSVGGSIMAASFQSNFPLLRKTVKADEDAKVIANRLTMLAALIG